MLTLITHVYNESYFIPFWLQHHKKLFDHLIVIDYHSTDNTVELCHTLWPGCDVRPSQNTMFDAAIVDEEVMQIESTLEGVKIVLNVTEFLFCKRHLHTLFADQEQHSYMIPTYSPYSVRIYNPTTLHELFRNLFNSDVTYHTDRGHRQLHNYATGNYSIGRHGTSNPHTHTESLFIMWFGFYPMNHSLLSRKMQIQTKIPQSDKDKGFGFQHLYSSQQIQTLNLEKAGSGKKLTEFPLLFQTLFLEIHPLHIVPKRHYRAVMLVLASNENKTVTNARKVWKKYYRQDPTIKVFFVYGQLATKLDQYDPESDLIFPYVRESYPVFIEKTIEAMKLIQSTVTYDFFIRTNISTFWDFPKLHLHLNELPTQLCYSGDGPLPNYNDQGYYVSGVDTIVTPEMIDSMIQHEHLVNFQTYEDAAMGLYFHGILGAPMLPNRICFFEDVNHSMPQLQVIERIDEAISLGKDHYRVKNNANREVIDKWVYIQLLRKIYGITSISDL